MLRELVRGGLARLGQSPRELFESMDYEMFLDIAYALITENMNEEQKKTFDDQLASIGKPAAEPVRYVTNYKGEKIAVSQERIDQARANQANLARMTSR